MKTAARIILAVAVVAIVVAALACYSVMEPKAKDCVVPVTRRMGVPSVSNPADTLWIDVLINLHMPCDSVPAVPPAIKVR